VANHTPPRARCRYTAFGEAAFTVAYAHEPAQAKAFIAELKDAVPYKFRTYDPALKEWRVWGGFEELAVALLLQHFADAEVPRRGRPHAKPELKPSGNDHFRVLHLRETAPVQLIEASYRILARLNHPDAGGSTEVMQAINGAYTTLRERVRA
jgi:hypothetical protein